MTSRIDILLHSSRKGQFALSLMFPPFGFTQKSAVKGHRGHGASACCWFILHRCLHVSHFTSYPEPSALLSCCSSFRSFPRLLLPCLHSPLLFCHFVLEGTLLHFFGCKGYPYLFAPNPPAPKSWVPKARQMVELCLCFAELKRWNH